MDRLDNFRGAYHELADRVRIALSTGTDSIGVRNLRGQILRLLAQADNAIDVFPSNEYEVLRGSVVTMLTMLLDVEQLSLDPPDQTELFVYSKSLTGKPGRPRLDFDPNFLQFALELRGFAGVARFFGCSARTVRRRALELGLVIPGDPPYHDIALYGQTIRVWVGCKRHTRLTDISDGQLDAKMCEILRDYPRFGRRMIDGQLRACELYVSRQRIVESYLRVHGPPPSFGFRRRIERRRYHVAGINSLWHHDGQHGLIKYKIVIHAFIDGKSRYITAVGAHNNNRAATVLALFKSSFPEHGKPKRIRGDHGVENVDVARWMDANQGRGSYIWGRSVHNSRVERLWYDLTQGVGAKWKDFFTDLEESYGLNPDNPAHLWLIHVLFLRPINRDITGWANGWNLHKLSLRDEPDRSPADMFLFGVLQHGPRGIQEIVGNGFTDEDSVDEFYGVDWDVLDDPNLRDHLYTNNPDEDWDDDNDSDGGDGMDNENPFAAGALPSHMNEVVCEVDYNPLIPQLEDELLQFLSADSLDDQDDLSSQTMASRYQIWEKSLQFCHQFNEQ